jgi:hypothetical protein
MKLRPTVFSRQQVGQRATLLPCCTDRRSRRREQDTGGTQARRTDVQGVPMLYEEEGMLT